MSQFIVAAEHKATKHLGQLEQDIKAITESEVLTNQDDFQLYSSIVTAVKENKRVILLSDNGIQASIVLNKYEGIRAGLAYEEYTAGMIREHNDANVMVVPLDTISVQKGADLFKTYVNTPMDTSNPKHQKRVDKLVQVIY